MGAFGFDGEAVGSGSGEDSSRMVERGGIRRWVRVIEGDFSRGGKE